MKYDKVEELMGNRNFVQNRLKDFYFINDII